MSAIWGEYTLGNLMPDNIDAIMSGPYRERCRIDRFAHTDFGPLYTGCGIQYVTPEAKEEILPYVDEERKIVLAADCILDNRKELLAELNGDGEQVCAPDAPDGTIVYHAYVKYGIECVKRFRGVFALAIYDGREDALYLVADQNASRVLNYYVTQGAVAFSTLIQPIRDLHPEIRVNENYLLDYITAPGMMPNLVAEETAYANVFRVEPGTIVKVSGDGVERNKYFSLEDRAFPFMEEMDHISGMGSILRMDCVSGMGSILGNGKWLKGPLTKGKAEKLGRAFRELYSRCVADALRSSGQTGIAMSSGLDSATVGALAATALREEGNNLYAYTYVPAVEYTPRKGCICDETEDVKQIANMHPNILTHFLNNNGANCLEMLPEILETLEMPVKAYGNLPSLCEIYDSAYRDGCRILLTGQFGNSTVSHGYIDDVLLDLYLSGRRFTMYRWLDRYSKYVGEDRRAARNGCKRYFAHAKEVLKTQGYGWDNYKPTNPFVTETALQHNIADRMMASGFKYWDTIPTAGEEYREMMCMTAPLSFIGDYETKLGLKYGIVLRDPTRDIRLQYFCYHLPYEIFAFRGEPRWLIRQNMKDCLPGKILEDWMRYGMQNVDLFERLARDVDRLGPVFDWLFGESPWVDNVAARKMLEEALRVGDPSRETDCDQAIFSGIISKFK